jgi:hypothetical protein
MTATTSNSATEIENDRAVAGYFYGEIDRTLTSRRARTFIQAPRKSSTTRTNLSGRSQMSAWSAPSQMAGIAVQSFLSAASGIAVVIALIRGFARRRAATIGNFWVDLTRGTFCVLLLEIELVGNAPPFSGRQCRRMTRKIEGLYLRLRAAPSTMRTTSPMMRFNSKSFGV